MDIDTKDLSQHTFSNLESSPHSLRQVSSPQTPPNMRYGEDQSQVLDEYTPSPHIINDSEEEYVTEDDLPVLEPTPSGRSSISSFPASIIHHNITPSQTFPYNGGLHTPSRSQAGTPTFHLHKPPSPLSTREHLAGFRNPSSVRALQMRDEFSDGEDYTPGHRRRGSRMSYVSYRSGSSYSTPGKRMSRSLQGSPLKNSSRLRKEFPLVLLHCSILPGMISPKMKIVNEELLEAIIPEPYKKRWKLLQEKVMRNLEVRERGVLIAHPKEDYDILEERLLESLELERSVINNGHFVGRSESRASTTDSGFGSEENSNSGDIASEEEEEHKCADCGGQLCGEKRWEIKVFAANGLMKAGAWSAAWSEMEKVDVQVSVRLPELVRQEIEARLDAVIAQEQQLQDEERQELENTKTDERTREIYGEPTTQKVQDEIDGLNEPEIVQHIQPSRKRLTQEQPIIEISTQGNDQVDLRVAVTKYIQLLLQDRRNIAIVLLTILLLFYGMSAQQRPVGKEINNQPATEKLRETRVEYLTETVVSTSTSTALETTTIVETTQLSMSVIPVSVNSARIKDFAEENLYSVVASSTTDDTIETPTQILAMLPEQPTLDSEDQRIREALDKIVEPEGDLEHNKNDFEEQPDASEEEQHNEMVKDEL